MKLPSRLFIAGLACAFALAAPGLLAAQAPGWTPTGPFGGTVGNLAVHPTIPGVLYAAVHPAGVLRTRDAGASWQLLSGTYGLNVGLVAIDPTQPRTLYAASTAPPARVLKSTDEGTTWTVVSRNLPPNLNIRHLVVDPGRPSRLYLTTTSRGIWRSGNGGATWVSVSQGFPGGASATVATLTATRKPAGTAYAGSFGGGLFRTRNAGNSWEQVRQGLPTGHVAAMAAAPSDPRTLYVSFEDAGIFRSRDGGESWAPAGNPVPVPEENPEIHALAIHPRSPLTVYAANSAGMVWKTTDGGRRWTPTTPIRPSRVFTLVLDNAAALYAGTAVAASDTGGVLRSADGGASWERRNRGLVGLTAGAVAIDPADPDNLVTAVLGAGLFRTANAGARWVPVRANFPIGRIPELLTSVLIAGAAGEPGTFYMVDASREPRIWKSSDAGRTWSPLSGPPGRPRLVRADPIDPGILYALTDNPGPALYRSEDGGATWAPLPPLPVTSTVADLEAARSSASAPAVLYLASGSLYRSTDGGATWVPAGAGLPDAEVSDLAVDPQDPRMVYAGVGGLNNQPLGVWKSTDSGATWQATGLDDRVIRALAVSPTGVLWASTQDGEVYRSEDSGAAWQELSGELALDVFEFAFGPDRVYAAGIGGVWVLEED